MLHLESNKTKDWLKTLSIPDQGWAAKYYIYLITRFPQRLDNPITEIAQAHFDLIPKLWIELQFTSVCDGFYFGKYKIVHVLLMVNADWFIDVCKKKGFAEPRLKFVFQYLLTSGRHHGDVVWLYMQSMDQPRMNENVATMLIMPQM